MKQNKMREEMKEAFINALKGEQIPWHCDWVRMGRPENAVTGKQYRGVNSIWLSYTQDRKGYQDPRWCTFKQAQKEGWKVKKGEKGARVEFWSLYDTETKQKISGGKVAELREQLGDDFYDRVKPISSVYTVFNAEQIEGIPERMTGRAQSLLPEELLAEKRDVLLKNMGLSFKEGGNEAFYQPRNDQITMPEIERFRSVYGYMSTFLHEAGHATGHESRLNRNIKNSFGTPDYAREELRAEIASAFVSQELGTIQAEPEHIENHKAYIQDWIAVLEKDPNELFAAIRDAEKISDYLIEKGEFGREEVKEAGRVDSNTVTEQELLKKESIGKSSPAGIPEGQEQGPDMSFYASLGFDRWQMEMIRTGLEQGLDVSLYASLDFHSSQMNMILLGLQDGYDVSVYARPEFSSSQMMEILNGLNEGVDIAVYADPKFSSMQMMEIRKGLEAELNVSSYADPVFDHSQMNLIREGLEQGLDVSVFARPEFNYSQMAEIKLGLKEGQDVSSYCDPDMDAKEMNRIRLEQKFAPLNEQTMSIGKSSPAGIPAGQEQKPDISFYASQGFDRWQMEMIRTGLEQGLDVSLYASLDFDFGQMNMIRLGLQDGYDVSVYARPEYSSIQMQEILDGLKAEVDIAFYADPKFTSTQMEVIKLGLREGQDVSSYCDPDMDAKEMNRIRLEQKFVRDEVKEAERVNDNIVTNQEPTARQEKEIFRKEETKMKETGKNMGAKVYASQGFDDHQMEEIQKGLEKKVDVNTYARKEFNGDQMREIRKGLEKGLDVSCYTDPRFDDHQMGEIREGLEKGVDASTYARKEFNGDQIKEIRLGLEKGLDVSCYTDPKYDCDQMGEIRIGLEKGLDISRYADPGYHYLQMEEILLGLEKGVDVSHYADPKYERKQMREIRIGLESGVDVSFYTNPAFDDHQMGKIREGLEDGLNVSCYADPGFNSNQMYEIRRGLKKELDVSFYTDPRFDDRQMEEIREGLEKGLDVSRYASPEYESHQMGQIQLGLEKGLDVSSYADPGFNSDQMYEIRTGLESGVDVNIYARKEFDSDQMKEIRLGMVSEVDVSHYADQKFNYNQMNEIRTGLEAGVDVGIYADQKFTYHAMKEIRLGLESGVDVSCYADPKYNSMQMEEIRLGLQGGLDVSTYADPGLNAREMERIRREQISDRWNEQKAGQPGLVPDTDSNMAKDSMTKKEIYRGMTAGEKELYDMNMDYGDVGAARKLLGEKRQELQQKQEISQGHPDSPLLGVQEAAKIRLVARGRNIAGFQPDPVHLQVAQMIREYQKNGLEIKDVVSGKMEEIRTKTGIADARYAKNLVCSIASRDIQSYEEYMGIPEGETAWGRPDRNMAAKQEHPGDIFHGNQKEGMAGFHQHGNQKTPVQGKAKPVMRGMGR